MSHDLLCTTGAEQVMWLDSCLWLVNSLLLLVGMVQVSFLWPRWPFGYLQARMHQIKKIKMDSWKENYFLTRETQDQIHFRSIVKMIWLNVGTTIPCHWKLMCTQFLSAYVTSLLNNLWGKRICIKRYVSRWADMISISSWLILSLVSFTVVIWWCGTTKHWPHSMRK